MSTTVSTIGEVFRDFRRFFQKKRQKEKPLKT